MATAAPYECQLMRFEAVESGIHSRAYNSRKEDCCRVRISTRQVALLYDYHGHTKAPTIHEWSEQCLRRSVLNLTAGTALQHYLHLGVIALQW